MHRHGWVLFIALLLSGCGDAGSESAADAAETAVRYGADVPIVNSEAPGDDTPVWTVDARPALDIGVLDGPPEYQFEQIWFAARLADGTIIVPDRGAHVVRYYDSTGVHLRSTGGEGSGPGEFEGIGTAFIGPADSLWTWDWGLRRLSVFSPSGEFARSMQIHPPEGLEFSPRPIAHLGDRVLVGFNRSFRPGDQGGVVRDTTPAFTYTPEGEPLDSLGAWPGFEAFVQSEGGGVSVTSRAFGRATQFEASGSRLYVADNDRYEIEVHEDGALSHVLRVDAPNRPLTAEATEAYRRERIAAADDQWREFTERMMAEMPFPETVPAFGAMVADADGNLWVQEYAPPGSDDASTWWVFDQDGHLAATAVMPAGLTVTDVGEDWVLGIWRDEMDVQHVRLHSLVKSADAEAD